MRSFPYDPTHLQSNNNNTLIDDPKLIDDTY